MGKLSLSAKRAGLEPVRLGILAMTSKVIGCFHLHNHCSTASRIQFSLVWPGSFPPKNLPRYRFSLSLIRFCVTDLSRRLGDLPASSLEFSECNVPGTEIRLWVDTAESGTVTQPIEINIEGDLVTVNRGLPPYSIRPTNG